MLLPQILYACRRLSLNKAYPGHGNNIRFVKRADSKAFQRPLRIEVQVILNEK
jgi:hypothetical protein